MDRLPELANLIGRLTPSTGIIDTAVERLSLIRADRPSEPLPWVYEASLCLIAQGCKRVSLGEQSVVYDASHYLLVSLDLPLVGHILEASTDAPYLCCKIDLDRKVLAELVLADGDPPPIAARPVLAVYPSDPELVDAACRLVRLLEQPEAIPTLAPLIEREILYRLLTGPHGPTLRRIGMRGSHLGRVGRAIEAIRDRFRESLRIADIAAVAGMSPSSLHEHFKSVTQMTPLEFQKRLRLHEARRLMLAEGVTASTAGFAVGYESASQFSREYRRLFGAPPRRDIERMMSLHRGPGTLC